MPRIVTDMKNIENPAASAMSWVWQRMGLPLWHLMTTLGALAGLATGVVNLCMIRSLFL